jgi:serine/threonine protein phosphatase 1
MDSLFKVFGKVARLGAGRRVPEGVRIYGVGDIHGRDDLLAEMAKRVEADLKRGAFDRALTVFLGDYVDRGPGTCAVLERLSGRAWPTAMVALSGNHEDMLKGFLQDERMLDGWRAFGGLETIHSYGIDVGAVMRGRDFKPIQAEFAARLPASHRQFLETLGFSITIGDYFFCHAGVKPGVPLELQDRHDLLNIRNDFLTSEEEHGKLVVHGHTPSIAPDVRFNRIGIDTAAYMTNCLTCIVLEKDRRGFLQTGQAEGMRREQHALELGA